MAFGNNSVSADSLLKTHYSDEKVANALFQKNKFLGMVPKNEKADGRTFNLAVNYSSGQGRSRSFSQAQTMAGLTGENMAQFAVPLVENHGDANVSSKLVAQTMSDAGAFMEAVTYIADNEMINFGNNLAISLYRDSSGTIGQVDASTNLSSSTLVLKNAKDVLSFEVGMSLDVAQAKTTGAIRAYGSNSHGLYVVAVDYNAGTISVGTTPVPGGTLCNLNDAADGCPLIASQDYIYVTGDRNVSMNGISDWIPYGGPASNDSFLGVNRFTNPVRLAGNWMDGTSSGIISAVLEDGIAQVAEKGGELTHFFMNHKQFANLSKELGSRTVLVSVPSTGDVGYEGIQVIGSTGPVVCLPDRSCPANTIFGVNIDTWELASVGKATRIWDLDGKVWLRSSTQSGMEIRFYSFSNLTCKDPRQNINILVNA